MIVTWIFWLLVNYLLPTFSIDVDINIGLNHVNFGIPYYSSFVLSSNFHVDINYNSYHQSDWPNGERVICLPIDPKFD